MSTNTELIKAIKDHFYGRVVDLVESGTDVNLYSQGIPPL